jgi:hypothetical protein
MATLDEALAGFGLSGGNVDLKHVLPTMQQQQQQRSAAGAASPSGPTPDFQSMTAGALKKWLAGAGADYSACVEKGELVALALKVAAAAKSGPGMQSPPGKGGASVLGASIAPGASRPSEWQAAGPKSALEMGMPNAFELHGMAQVLQIVFHHRSYRSNSK